MCIEFLNEFFVLPHFACNIDIRKIKIVVGSGTIFPQYFVDFTIVLLYIGCNNLFTHRSCTRPILKNEYVSMHIQIDTFKVFMRIFVWGGVVNL